MYLFLLSLAKALICAVLTVELLVIELNFLFLFLKKEREEEREKEPFLCTPKNPPSKELGKKQREGRRIKT